MAKDNWKWVEEKSGKRFINPYNFVRLNGETQRSEPETGELTGKITVSLIVKTPLAIPDSENVITEQVMIDGRLHDHKKYTFFRVGEKPVIPGSQLRGMIRSAYETLSNSCLSVNNNNIMSARHANPGTPGLVQFKGGEWHLYEAALNKDFCNSLDKSSEVRRTWYTIDGKATKTKIFRSKGTEIVCANIERAIENYDEDIKKYDVEKSSFRKYKSKLTYGIRKDGNLYPVFYEIVEYEGENYVYFSPSQMGRYVFDNRLDDLLGSHVACSKTHGTELCKACSLFGMIPDKGDNIRKAYSGRLRFSDAQANEFDSFKSITLKELAGPKITSVEFYTQQPKDALYWTFDYKIGAYKKVVQTDKKGRSNTQSVPMKEKCEITVRGRKYFLHNPNIKPSDYQTSEKTKRNSSMELCKPGSRFNFDIYFEKISEEQLKELLWTITIGENSVDSMQMYKLGHGKPLGLGSVKLVVDDVMLRSFDADTLNYSIEHLDDGEIAEKISEVPFDKESSTFIDFMQITKFDGLSDIMKSKKADICYPLADDDKGGRNSKASHQWFIGNRSMGESGTTTSWSVKYDLPGIMSANLTLPALFREKKYDSNGGSGYRYSDSVSKRPYTGKTQFGDSGTGGFFSNIKKKK